MPLITAKFHVISTAKLYDVTL